MNMLRLILRLAVPLVCVIPMALAQTPLACSVDRPIVAPGGTLRLRTYAEQAGRKPATWVVSQGTLFSENSAVLWTVPRSVIAGDRLSATATIAGSPSKCSVSVVGVPDDFSRGPLVASWFPLLPNAPRLSNFGLYSYILLGSVPTESVRPTVLSALEAYIGFAPFLKELQRHVDSKKINITLVPTKKAPENISPPLLLENYDYATAKAIMFNVGGLKGDGIYLVSSLTPLQASGRNNGTLVAVQELSRVPPNVVSLWVREFLRQTSDEQIWDPPAMDRLVLYLRTTVAVLGEVVPEIQTNVTEWIRLIGGTKAKGGATPTARSAQTVPGGLLTARSSLRLRGFPTAWCALEWGKNETLTGTISLAEIPSRFRAAEQPFYGIRETSVL